MLNLEHGRAYLAKPQAGKSNGAGVLLLHAWWGLNDFFIALADRLAAEGFVVLAPDMFDGEVASTIEQAETLSSAKNDEARIIPLIDEALDHLKSLPDITAPDLGLIGVSFGAAWGLVTADRRPDVIGALVLFYGVYTNDWRQIRAAFQGHYAENDPFESLEGVEQLKQNFADLNLDATFFIYPGMEHWFFETDRPQYHPENARLAWERTVKFLKETLSPQ